MNDLTCPYCNTELYVDIRQNRMIKTLRHYSSQAKCINCGNKIRIDIVIQTVVTKETSDSSGG